MKVLFAVSMILIGAGCSDINGELSAFRAAVFSEAEVCDMCLERSARDWPYGGFDVLDEKESKCFVDRMFRHRDFFPEDLEISRVAQDMTRHLVRGDAKGYYAETDRQEFYLYVDLKVKEKSNRYYSYDNVVYDKSSNRILHVGSGDVGDLELWENRQCKGEVEGGSMEW